MITVLSQKFNSLSQKIYDSVIASLQLHLVKCTCGKGGCLIFYGHYHRKIKYCSDLIDLCIQRVRCKECGTSHALIPSSVVPYSRSTLEDQQEILLCFDAGRPFHHVLARNYLIDESNARYIVRQYSSFWKQRLLSLGLTLKDALTAPCLLFYSLQFMQIHRTRNKLYPFTNTT